MWSIVAVEGDSGITNVRGSRDGNEDYDDGTYSNGNVLSIHNHANNIKVVGIGEIEAVLNGVEFKTRHNDYDLNMPHRNSSEYHATEPVANLFHGTFGTRDSNEDDGGLDLSEYADECDGGDDRIDDENLQYLNGSDLVTETESDIANGHTQTVNIWRWRADDQSTWNYVLDSCRFGLKTDDDVGWTNSTCADFHDAVRRDIGEESFQ